MCCLWFSWSSCVFFCCVLLQTTGTRITNCASGSVEVVADTADFSLTCVEYTGTVQWRYTLSTQPDVFNVIGSCGSSCQLDREALSRSFSLTQLSATSSRLGLKSTATSASLPVFTYFCADSSCSVSIVVHAELSTPTLTVTTPATGSGWTVRGNVDITRIFSSAGQYSCVWEEKRPGSGSYTQIVNKAPTINTPANTTGHCDFPDRTLSATAGTYTYRVTVSPGQTVKTDSSVVVETPATPSISCSPTGYVSEGGELTCTCSGDVGRPAGRLQLFRESTNTFTSGQYGGDTLQEKLTVSKADNGKKVRCDVDWITDITGADFTIQVAYGPTRADLSNPPVYELHPTQSNNQPLTLTCSAVGVNPDATYSWSGSRCDGTTGSTCSFVPTQGDNGGGISCTAVNTITSVRKTSDTRTLRIHYPPSSPPVITGYSGGVLYAGNTQSMTCTVQGGNPAVSSVTFTCDGGGQQVNGGNSTSKTIQVTASRDNNGRQCTCSANWKNKNPPWYTQTASVTLQVYYAAEVSQFTVNNANNVTVSEGDPVTLTCKAVGRPKAAMAIVKEGSTLNSTPQGQVSAEEEATLTYRKDGATCDATGQYRCDVDNGEGQANAAHLMVFVNCSPRQQEGSPEIPTYLNYKGGCVSTEFPLTMYPAVKSATLQYLGPLSKSTTSSPARENLYKLQCTATDPSRLYWTTCKLTIRSATRKDKGFYSVTLGNGVGQPFVFLFELDVSGSAAPDRSQSSPGSLSTGIAVGVTVAVFFIIISVFVIWVWRRHWVLPCAETRKQDDKRARHRNQREDPQPATSVSDVYELREDGSPRHVTDTQPGSTDIGVQCNMSDITQGLHAAAAVGQEHQPTSVYTSLRTSDIGVPSVYSDISPYRNTGAAVDQGPGPVYENSGTENRAVYVNVPHKP